MSSTVGVLVDVSGSMEEAYALDSSNDASAERVHSIITSVLNIVNRETTRHNMYDEIFVGAFGLCGEADTCDLIDLLGLIAGPKECRGKEGHEALIALAKRERVEHTECWIREHLTENEARDLYRVLCFDESLIPKLVRTLPDKSREQRPPRASSDDQDIFLSLLSWIGAAAGLILKPIKYPVKKVAVKVHRSYRFAHSQIDNKDKIIRKSLQEMQHPLLKPVRYVSELLDDLNLTMGSLSSDNDSLHHQIRELINPIKPYIYGRTPMRKAMEDDALAIFRESRVKSKVLFILSDGQSTDGDPRPIAQELKKLGVTIVTCYLTADHIVNPRCLLDQADPTWPKDGRAVLFKMSSTMRNIDPPVSYLMDAKWALPASGVSHLFVQANSLDMVDEICKMVVSQLTNPCDTLVDILERVDLSTYINQTNAGFDPKKQVGGTCYANAIAAVFHLAMHRIVGRDRGHPDFYQIRDRLIQEYGKDGANTKRVLEKVCTEYRLHFREVDEMHARQALNHRRPVVATFSLYDEQWTRLSYFYRKTPKGILQRSDVGDGSTKPGGHAVVLIRCSPKCLVFMNSWGQNWADGGFFSVEDAQVLNNMKFYDVFWTENDLSSREKRAYQQAAIKKTEELSQTYPSINDLLFQCPKCSRNSKLGEFKGHVLEAKCPKCGQKFKPTNADLLSSLYTRSD